MDSVEALERSVRVLYVLLVSSGLYYRLRTRADRYLVSTTMKVRLAATL